MQNLRFKELSIKKLAKVQLNHISLVYNHSSIVTF